MKSVMQKEMSVTPDTQPTMKGSQEVSAGASSGVTLQYLDETMAFSFLKGSFKDLG